MTKGDRDKLRAELAGGIAAAIVSTIKDDDGYNRFWNLGNELGLTVSQWIAKMNQNDPDWKIV